MHCSCALRYAARGLRVLPLRERDKRPLLDHGVHDASADPGTIRRWWSRWPSANIAIAVPPEWFVLDVDPRHGGDVELDRLEREHGPLPVTVTARTGSGGRHLLFARPTAAKLRGRLRPGLDLLSVGKYFLVAPSVHPCGGAYSWTSPRGTAIAQPPAWLNQLVTVQPEPPAPIHPVTLPATTRVDRARRYLERVPPAISGGGGHAHTFTTALKLARGFCLDESTAFSLMVVWNRACQPPWSAKDLARKVKEAARAGRMPVGAMLDDGRAA